MKQLKDFQKQQEKDEQYRQKLKRNIKERKNDKHRSENENAETQDRNLLS